MMVRFMFTTVTFVSYQKNPFDIIVCLLSSCSASGLLLSCLYVFCFSSSLLIFYFLFDTVIESARFVMIYHSSVPIPTWHNTKLSISRLTNHLLLQQIFHWWDPLMIFLQRFMIVFDVNRSNWVSTDSQHILFPLLLRTHWTHTYI